MRQARFGRCLALALLAASPALAQTPAEPTPLDRAFDYGEAAFANGDYAKAIDVFTKMLEVDPSLDRVRLDLALSYARLGRYAEARKQFAVVDSHPGVPEQVKKNIALTLAAIDNADRRHILTGSVTGGYLWDSNGNSAPGTGNVLVNDTLFTLDKGSRARGDGQFFGSVNLGHTYRIQDSRMEWRSTGTYYQTEQNDLDRLDLKVASLQTGPSYRFAHDKTTASLTGGYTFVILDGATYLRLYSAEAELQHALSPRLTLVGSLREEYRDFVNAPGVTIYDDRSGPAHQLRGGFFYRASERDLIDLFLTLRREDADEDRYSDRQITPELGYTHSFDRGYFSRILATYRDSDYDDPDLFVSTKDRHDKEKSVGLTLGRNFENNVSITVGYEYRKADSTIANYDFDNHRISTNLGWRF